MQEQSRPSSDPDLWLAAAGVAQRKMGGCAGPYYRAWLKQSVDKLPIADRALLDAIASLNCRVATTNYNSLLCNYLGVQPKTWRNPSAVAEIFSGESRNVWHIHGYWDEPESVIFSSDDYNGVARSQSAQFLQRSAAFTDTLIFIGCSNDGLADQNIGRLLDWFEQNWKGSARPISPWCATPISTLQAGRPPSRGWPMAPNTINCRHSCSLAPRPLDAANSIEKLIPTTPTFGRDAEIGRIVAAALNLRSCIVTGAPGMGKTKVAVAAAYNPKTVERSGRGASSSIWRPAATRWKSPSCWQANSA